MGGSPHSVQRQSHIATVAYVVLAYAGAGDPPADQIERVSRPRVTWDAMRMRRGSGTKCGVIARQQPKVETKKRQGKKRG